MKMKHKNYWGITPLKVKPTMFTPPKLKDKPQTFKPILRAKQGIPKRPNKSLTYPQAKRRYGLSPFGDWDRDNRVNIYDCRPFNPRMHKVPSKHKDRVVTSFAGPPVTWKKLWSEAEEQMEHAFLGSEEDKFSQYLEEALIEREETQGKVPLNPIQDIVGEYNVGKVRLDRNQTALAQSYIIGFLGQSRPNESFEFYDPERPTLVRVTNHITGEVREGRSVGKYLTRREEDTPPEVRNLLTLLTPYTNLLMVITDYPLDILKKATVVTCKGRRARDMAEDLTWKSCETLGRADLGETNPMFERGPFSDVAYQNAICWFYLGNNRPGKDFPNARVMLRWGTATGGWSDTSTDIGIEYKASRDDPKFYGMSGRSARGLIGELQKVLRAKGFNSKIVTTPFYYKGYSDTLREGSKDTGIKIEYEPYPIQKPEPALPLKEIKKEFVERPGVQKQFLHHLSFDKDSAIRIGLARRPKAPEPQVIYRLAKDKEEEVRKRVVMSKWELPPHAWQELLTDPSEDIKYALSKREDIPDDIKLGLIESSVKVAREYILTVEGKIPEDIKEKLISHKDAEVRLAYASRPGLSGNDVIQLSEDESEDVRMALIEYQVLPPDVIKFFCDPKFQIQSVRLKMAGYAKLPEGYVKDMGKNDPEGQVRGAILCRKDVSQTLVKWIAEHDKSYAVLSSIASRGDLTQPIVDKLVANPECGVDIFKVLIDNASLSNAVRMRAVKTYISHPKVSADGVVQIAKLYSFNPVVLKEIMNYLENWKNVAGEKPHVVMDALAVSTDMPVNMRNDVFAFLFSEGDIEVHKKLLKNGTVHKEIKDLIKKKVGYY